MGLRALSAGSPVAGRFVTTRWSVVLTAGGENSGGEAAEALAQLCKTYWYPLYSHERRRGHTPEDSADLTQEFFRRFLEKGYGEDDFGRPFLA